ncbi:hypothetical protein LguiB_026851 [Lonicera macranthoides]
MLEEKRNKLFWSPCAAHLIDLMIHDIRFKADKEVKIGLYKTIERMYPDYETRIQVDEQLEKFCSAKGLFGICMAKLTRDKKQPGI